MSNLFRPLSIGSLTLKNRIVVSPMCQYSSVDGFANDWHLVHLGTRAVGGAALVFTEATAVSAEGRISPQDLGIWDDRHIEKLQQITQFIHAQDSLAGIQLAHAGRKASTLPPWDGNAQISLEEGGWETLAPSAIPYKTTERAPVALDKEGIQKVILDFKNAAKRAVAAGFDIIEIHAAHGYLLHQFMSPLSNQREDDYGGSFENRIKLLLEVVEAIQSELKEGMPLFVRISATDWAEGGWDIEASVKLSAVLKEKGVALMDVSTGALVTGIRIPIEPGYQVPFAAQIRKETGILTGAVGLITEAQQAEAILTEGKADLIFMAREMLRNPYFALHAAQTLNNEAHFPVQYERAQSK
ncbi:NADPH dehydrogenase NamA [Taibaiella lutea]|uniref:NADPH dehydrogenase NamA n=1 Tax=Taibaiella lutea TaxID=2608001 RepID=A0A5M6CP20_9BACT|nr:NADPH dehydrogenase NamA [Taibaiella lutea]KAA5536847.1 NADPH dehydrogenase NamA [Taibaiella lutea]